MPRTDIPPGECAPGMDPNVYRGGALRFETEWNPWYCIYGYPHRTDGRLCVACQAPDPHSAK